MPARRQSLRASRPLLPALVVVALMGAGCGTRAHPAPVTHESSGPVQVLMKILEFTPAAVHARVGQRVVWMNDDSSPHNVTYVSGPRFTSSRLMRPGATFSIGLTAPGTIHYFCTIHPWMQATIAVSR